MIKNKKTEIFVLALILFVQCIVYVCFGANKSYLHMDEAYSLGLASYDKVEIQHNEDFYDTWHSGEYYRDYLEVDEDEKGDFTPVYENQKNDVHPPFYYLLLRLFMGFSVGEFTMWGGLALNIIIHLFITVFTYFIAKRLIADGDHVNEKAAFLTLISSITLATLTSVLYIRMYSLVSLIVLITVYLHIKLHENREHSLKYMILIGVAALFGSLTHYFYLYFIFALFIVFTIAFIARKEYKNLGIYIAVLAVAAAVSLLIFPHSLTHMFLGYRGQGVIENLFDPVKYSNIFVFLHNINETVFNYLFWPMLFMAVILHFIRHRKNIETSVYGKQFSFFVIIGFPTLFSFVITSISSPWLEIRYILPIITLIFLLGTCYFYRLLRTLRSEKNCNGFIVAMAAIMLFIPVALGVKPDTLYAQREDAVETMIENEDVPALYFFNSSNNRFLDDILLFSIADESYIAKDVGANEEKLREIFADVDTEDGVIVFINEGQDHNALLETLKNTLGLENIEYLHGLNACWFYKIS